MYPDNFLVQKVAGATHLFSQSSVEGLARLEEKGLVTGTIATRKMASFFNEIFDLFNTSLKEKKPSRFPIKRYEFDRFARLEDIRQHLLRWKSDVEQGSRLSNITINHWNVTIQSIVSCMEVLFGEGWEFVQTRRFNQDNLEVISRFSL